MKPDEMLREAQSAPALPGALDAYRETIAALHAKNHSFRQIAAFLKERGVKADAGGVHRVFTRYANTTTKEKSPMYATTIATAVPPAAAYIAAINEKDLAPHELAMLRAHYHAPNRSITYTELAAAAGWDNYGAANLHYGYLGRRLGEATGFAFPETADKDGKKVPFYSAALGMGSPFRAPDEDFVLVMHAEVAKAVEALKLV